MCVLWFFPHLSWFAIFLFSCFCFLLKAVFCWISQGYEYKTNAELSIFEDAQQADMANLAAGDGSSHGLMQQQQKETDEKEVVFNALSADNKNASGGYVPPNLSGNKGKGNKKWTWPATMAGEI